MAVGVNVTVNVQLLDAASELPQVLVCPKSPGFEPVKEMLLMARVAFPVLCRENVCELLVVFRV
jgi:hypothetical protein